MSAYWAPGIARCGHTDTFSLPHWEQRTTGVVDSASTGDLRRFFLHLGLPLSRRQVLHAGDDLVPVKGSSRPGC